MLDIEDLGLFSPPSLPDAAPALEERRDKKQETLTSTENQSDSRKNPGRRRVGGRGSRGCSKPTKRAVHQCDCGLKYDKYRSLKIHRQRAHNASARFPCPEGCGKLLSSRTAIGKHLLSHRPEEEWPHACPLPLCRKRFQARGDIPKHLMTSKHANDAIPTMGSKEWFDLIYLDDPKSKSKKKQESKGYVRAVEVVEEVEVPVVEGPTVVEGVSALEERQDNEREALKAIENHADADSRQNPGKRRREESQFQFEFSQFISEAKLHSKTGRKRPRMDEEHPAQSEDEVLELDDSEARQNKSKKLEKDKESPKLSIAEKEQSVIIQREEHAKKAQETSEQIEQTIEAQKREHEKDWAELKKSAEEKDQKISDLEKLRDADAKKVQELIEEIEKKKEVEKNLEARLCLQKSEDEGQIEALKEENVALRKELKKNENEGFEGLAHYGRAPVSDKQEVNFHCIEFNLHHCLIT